MTDSQAAVAPRRSRLPGPAKFWIGVLLTIPVMIVVGTLNALVSGMFSGHTQSTVESVLNWGLFAALIVAMFWRPTRWYAFGVSLGFALLVVLFFVIALMFLNGLAKIF